MDNGVGGEESGEGGVEDSAVHVDEAEVVEVFVAGEAAGEGAAGAGVVVEQEGAHAPGVVGEAFVDASVFVAQGGDGAEAVGMIIAGFNGFVLGVASQGAGGDFALGGVNVVFFLREVVGAGDDFEEAADVGGFGGGGAVVAFLDDAFAVCAKAELRPGDALGDFFDLVEGGPVLCAVDVGPGGHVSIGVVGVGACGGGVKH